MTFKWGKKEDPPIHPPAIPTLYSIFCSRLVFGISQAVKKLLLAQRPAQLPRQAAWWRRRRALGALGEQLVFLLSGFVLWYLHENLAAGCPSVAAVSLVSPASSPQSSPTSSPPQSGCEAKPSRGGELEPAGQAEVTGAGSCATPWPDPPTPPCRPSRRQEIAPSAPHFSGKSENATKVRKWPNYCWPEQKRTS